MNNEARMNTRLNITVFGTMHVVGALHLTPQSVRAGIGTYGKMKWNEYVSKVALGEGGKGLWDNIVHTIGHPLPIVYSAKGVSLNDGRFGIEAFYGGEHYPLEFVEAENRALQPNDLMQDYKSGDILAVFRAERAGTMSFRWDAVSELNPADVVLVYDSVSKLIPDAGQLELALDVTWQGKVGKRPELRPEPLSSVRHVFHKVK